MIIMRDVSIFARCSQCGRSLLAREEDGGRSVTCPVCRRSVWVPPDNAATPRVGPTVPQPGDAPRRNLGCWCALVLLTAVIPWHVVQNVPVWPWQVFRQLPKELVTAVMAEWVVAACLLLLAGSLRRLALSLVQTLVPLVFIALVAPGVLGWVAAMNALPEMAMPVALAGLAVVPLHIMGYLRWRLGHSVAVAVLHGGCAALCGVLAWLAVRGTTGVVLWGAAGLVMVASGLAMIHACGLGRRWREVTLVSHKLLLVALTWLVFAAVVVPCRQAHNVDLGLPIAIGLVLSLAMPVLVLTGVARVLADLADWAWPARPAVRKHREPWPARLVLREGGRRLVCPVLPGKPLTMGRAMGNTIVLPNPALSSSHLRIEWREDDWWLTDLESANGTRVNGREVDETVLVEGDVIEAGDRQMRLEMVKPPVPVALKVAVAVWLVVLVLAAAAGTIWWLKQGR
jgi:hypothetical protein